jgi:hypothetical protein
MAKTKAFLDCRFGAKRRAGTERRFGAFFAQKSLKTALRAPFLVRKIS